MSGQGGWAQTKRQGTREKVARRGERTFVTTPLVGRQHPRYPRTQATQRDKYTRKPTTNGQRT